MVEDKYVGLALAVSGTVAIGSSFIITKKVYTAFLQSDDLLPSVTQGLNEAGDRGHSYTQASDDHAYLKNPVWWVGMAISERLRCMRASSANPSDALSVVLGECAFCFQPLTLDPSNK